jgi:NADH:ubiquinone oxidoreductase subunit D
MMDNSHTVADLKRRVEELERSLKLIKQTLTMPREGGEGPVSDAELEGAADYYRRELRKLGLHE